MQRDASSLRSFAELLGEAAVDARFQPLLPQLAEAGALDQALALLKRAAPARVPLRRILEAALARDRAQRQARWQLDQDRLLWRLRYERRGPAAALLPPAFLGALVDLLGACGIQPALSLERRPRPLVHLGPPLPLGTEGLAEVVDAELAKDPALPAPLDLLNARAPAGLRFTACEALPPYATPALDLARSARWTWPCPPAQRPAAGAAVAAFLAAPAFTIEKRGKQDGQKAVKQVEVRRLVQAMAWSGDLLAFDLRHEPGQALHPAKLLGGVLGVDPGAVQGLVRTALDLAEDPRLAQGERFQPKLKNMFEDAVLLRAESSLKIIDEDEDDPLVLG